MATPAPARERRGLVLAVGAAALFSTAPLLTRYVGDGLGPYEISFWRTTIGAIVVLSAALLLRRPMPQRRTWRSYLLTGLFAALHFVCYIAAVQYTTIAHALAIVYTAPVWTALFARLQGESLSPRKWVGIGVAVTGVAILAGLGADPNATLVGDLLALVSALMFAAYTIAGRRNQGAVDVLPYAGTVYLFAALWALPAAAATWSSGGYTPQVVAGLIALGLFPLALGHTLYNAALRSAPATAVNVLATQELTFGVVLGALLLGEIPTATSMVGVVVTMLGAILVIL